MNSSFLTFESVDGIDLVIADYRGCMPDEFLRRLRVVSDWVVQQPPRSVLIITLVKGIVYDPGAMRELVAMLRETKPHVRASAVVGLGHLTLLIRVINHLSGRGLQAFESVEEAKQWLTELTKRAPAVRSGDTSRR
ncbi:MAG: hypothetical protein HYU52_04600 [Acidobacteria bacterium]|nr:hypothetical protein [Acidobacteriota bacterium]